VPSPPRSSANSRTLFFANEALAAGPLRQRFRPVSGGGRPVPPAETLRLARISRLYQSVEVAGASSRACLRG